MAAALDVGRFEWAGYCAILGAFIHLETGAALAATREYVAERLEIIRKHRLEAMEPVLQIQLQLLDVLAQHGDAEHVARFEAAARAACLACERHSFEVGSAMCRVMAMLLCYLYELTDQAQARADSLPERVAFIRGHSTFALYQFYRGLIAARRKDLTTLHACCVMLELWARDCPENFAHRALLLTAESARLQGDIARAQRCYDQARLMARQNHFSVQSALSHELTGKHYLTLGVDDLGYHCLRQARIAFSHRGAEGRVNHLDIRFPALQRDIEPEAHPDATSVLRFRHLDWLSVVKASQTISSEIASSQLLPTLLEVVRESAGAQRVCLLLNDHGQLWLDAEIDADGVSRSERVPFDEAAGTLATHVINFVRRTGKRVILEDARIDHLFNRDPYIMQAQPKSMLCQLITRRHETRGVIYMENNAMAAVFDAERAAVLDMIVGQIAISIDNARLYQRAQNAIRDRESFLGIAAHELKTPLATLQLRVDSLLAQHKRAQLTPERAGQTATVLKTQVLRLGRLIDNLFDVTQIRGSNLTLHPAEIDLAELTREVVDDSRDTASAANCSIQVDLHPARGVWDGTRIAQVANNLLSNACKYAPGAPIHVCVEAEEQTAIVRVADAGPGIAPEQIERIFTPFERLAPKSAVEGLGLGLYICQQIARAHGGEMHVASTPGAGTVFTLTLSRHR